MSDFLDISTKSSNENNFLILTYAIDFIEENLCFEFSQEDIAKACLCSLSSLQKLWKYCTHLSLNEYITKRRLTNAARDILETDDNLLDIAVKYGYNSHEAFTRAFVRVWQCTPSYFRKNRQLCWQLYPKLNKNYFKEAVELENKKFDINEAYDYFTKSFDTYVLCFDICGLNAINENIGRKAGDMVILEVMKRLSDAAEGRMMLRIGGDEFIIFTQTNDVDEVKIIAEKVLADNGKAVKFEENTIAVSLHCGAITIRKPLKYTAFFNDFDKVIGECRESSGEKLLPLI